MPKKVIIDDLWIKEAKVHLELLGKMATISLSDIHLTNIGRESGGVTPSRVVDQAMASVLSGIASGAGKAVAGKGGKIGSGLKGLFKKK